MIGDHHPESGKILLPIGVHVKEVYIKYAKQSENPITKSAFYAIWKKKMTHVVRQKVKMQLHVVK